MKGILPLVCCWEGCIHTNMSPMSALGREGSPEHLAAKKAKQPTTIEGGEVLNGLPRLIQADPLSSGVLVQAWQVLDSPRPCTADGELRV